MSGVQVLDKVRWQAQRMHAANLPLPHRFVGAGLSGRLVDHKVSTPAIPIHAHPRACHPRAGRVQNIQEDVMPLAVFLGREVMHAHRPPIICTGSNFGRNHTDAIGNGIIDSIRHEEPPETAWQRVWQRRGTPTQAPGPADPS